MTEKPGYLIMTNKKISFISHAFTLGVIVTVVFFLLAGVLAAEAPSEEWNRTYGGGEGMIMLIRFSRLKTVDIYLQGIQSHMELVRKTHGL
ncbi:MAG: hypothetical protein SVY15_03700 [Halobacteriota archaeon]|nr:hypothetical protein [Halobacteriota archaeon]